MKKNVKWIIAYILIGLAAFGLIIWLEADFVMEKSSYLEYQQDAEIFYQSVNSFNESSLIIWNSKLTEDKVVRVDEGRDCFRIIDNLFQF